MDGWMDVGGAITVISKFCKQTFATTVNQNSPVISAEALAGEFDFGEINRDRRGSRRRCERKGEGRENVSD